MRSEYQSGRGPHFSMVPWELQDDPEVDAWMVAVYAAVRRFADFGSGTGSFVSDRRGAEVAGCSERTFRDRRDKLRQIGWIEWQSRRLEVRVPAPEWLALLVVGTGRVVRQAWGANEIRLDFLIMFLGSIGGAVLAIDEGRPVLAAIAAG